MSRDSWMAYLGFMIGCNFFAGLFFAEKHDLPLFTFFIMWTFYWAYQLFFRSGFNENH